VDGNSRSLVEAAIEHGYRAQAVQLLNQGAKVSEQALVDAVTDGDATTVGLLLAKRKTNPQPLNPPNGEEALKTSYFLGREDLINLLVADQVSPDSLVDELSSRAQYLVFLSGDVRWQRLLPRLSDKTQCPQTISKSIDDVRERRPKLKDEALVLAVLNDVLSQQFFSLDHTIGLDSLVLPSWVKDSSGRRENWSILAALYPAEVKPVTESKATKLFVLLARHVSDQRRRADILEHVIVHDNVELLDLLVQQGFDLRLINFAGQDWTAWALDRPGSSRQSMTAYLGKHGITFAH
jgi:hypothetical protein